MVFEKRKHNRISSFNLFYLAIDDNGNIIHQGMGRTLNVSEAGILLQTSFNINLGLKILLSIGIEDDIVDIEGDVAHSRIGKKGMFETGIKFTKIDDDAFDILKIFIQYFENNKKER
jgi:hypothetical protein